MLKMLQEMCNEMADDKERLNHNVTYPLRQMTQHDGSVGNASGFCPAGDGVQCQLG
jgi:hypothetical protein